AVAGLLLGVVGLLGAEGLHEQGPLQAACQRHRQHLGREQRGERARRTPQRRHPDGVPFGLPQEPLDNVPEPGLVRGVGVNLACRAQHWLPPPQTLSLSRPAIAISLATSFSLYPLSTARASMARVMCSRKHSITYFMSRRGGRERSFAQASAT